MPVNTNIQIRKGTATQWSSTNPVLGSGEPGFDTTNKILKIGNGSTSWNSLLSTSFVADNAIFSNVNVLGATYDSVSFSVAGQETNTTDVFFSPDGLKMYALGTVSDNVNEYNLSTPWVVSSAAYSTAFSVLPQDTTAVGMFFRADGVKMYISGATNDTVFQYTLSTPWSVATASYDSISFSVTTQELTPHSVFFKPNGLSMYIVGSNSDNVVQYTLSTAWNVSSATYLQSFSISSQENESRGLWFVGDGSRMLVCGTGSDGVNVYNLSTPWDISTATFVNMFSVSDQDILPQAIYIKPDGTKMYIIGNTNDTVYQYTVPSIDIQLTGQTSAAALDVQQDLKVYGKTTVANLTASLENYTEKVVPIGNSSTTKTISLTNGNVQTCTLTGNCVFTMPTAVAGKSFLLFLYTGAGSFTASFTSVKFPGGSAPTISTTASRTDLLSFVSDGTSWYGSYVQNYS